MSTTNQQPAPLPDGFEAICAVADEATRIAANILRRGLGKVRSIRFKGDVDLVTEYDQQVEEAITQVIRQHFPDHRIVAEEGSVGGASPDHVWYIDPLDGTTNFAHGFPVFCTSIAYEYRDQLVLGRIVDPTRNEVYRAEAGRGAFLNGRRLHVSTVDRLIGALIATGFPYDRNKLEAALDLWKRLSYRAQGVRRNGSAALELAYVAAGRLDAFYEAGLNSWDAAAGAVLIREAGGTVSSFTGDAYHPRDGGIVASNGLVHEALLAVIRGDG